MITGSDKSSEPIWSYKNKYLLLTKNINVAIKPMFAIIFDN